MAYEHTTIMYHQLSWGSGYGKALSINETNEWIMEEQKKLDEIILSNTKITKKQLTDVNEKKKDWYMTPEEALKLGVIDEIMVPIKK